MYLAKAMCCPFKFHNSFIHKRVANLSGVQHSCLLLCLRVTHVTLCVCVCVYICWKQQQ